MLDDEAAVKELVEVPVEGLLGEPHGLHELLSVHVPASVNVLVHEHEDDACLHGYVAEGQWPAPHPRCPRVLTPLEGEPVSTGRGVGDPALSLEVSQGALEGALVVESEEAALAHWATPCELKQGVDLTGGEQLEQALADLGVTTGPHELAGEIEDLVGEYITDVKFRVEDRNALLKQVYDMTERRFQVIEYMLQEKPWDFFAFVEIGLDRIHHAFWKFFDETHHLYSP